MGLGSPKISDQFSWISFIDTLAGGDITKYDAVSSLRYEECLFKLLYDHHKDKYNAELNRRQMIRNRNKK